MKKCPFCKADIEENSSFCLYCMSHLDEKKVLDVKENRSKSKRIILIGIAIIICIVSVLGINSVLKNDEPPTKNLNSTNVSKSEDDGNVKSEASSFAPSEEDVFETDSNAGENENSNPTEDKQQIVYKYRNSVHGDEVNGYGISAEYIENGITITGVETVSENGVYIIPENIDGKKVIAIASNAFCEDHIKDTVKIVFVPKTVVGIQNYAFSDCYNMTDLYIQGESVAGNPDLFFPTLENANNTIIMHASKSCNGRDLMTFADRYHYYAVTCGHELVWKFEEWDALL